MTYKDMTFCKGDGCTKFATCFRALTPAVEKRAAHWWGGDDYPISFFADPKSLDCYETEIIPKPETNT